MQEDNHPNSFASDVARVVGSALGAAQSAKQDIHIQFQEYVEKILKKMHVVQREEFDIVNDMLSKAREEQERLKERLAILEKKLGE